MSDPGAESTGSRSNWKNWRIPTRIYGRIRTSTVFFSVCFVLTALLYVQVNEVVVEQNEQSVQGPTAIDPNQPGTYVPQQESTYQQSTTTSATTTPTAPESSADPESPGNAGESGAQTTTSVPPTTTTNQFGVPLPPAIQSLIPTQPAPTTPR